MCPSSKRMPPHPSVRSARLFSESRKRREVMHLGRARMAIGVFVLVAAVMAAALAWRVLQPGGGPRTATASPALDPGVEGPPALSPDGNLVAFAWSGHDAAGPTDIYVKAVDSDVWQLTATPGSETSRCGLDGHSLAFVRDGQGVFTMSQLGGAERQVSASGTNVAWAGDSKSVLIRDREETPGPLASTRWSSIRWSDAG